MKTIRKLWDPMIKPWPYPICYYPPIWELVINREILDDPIPLVKLVSDDPVPIKANMIKYFNARIELTKSLIGEGKLDSEIGERAIKHFETHLKELEGSPVPIPIP